MIIETSCNRFYQVQELNDANLAHVWTGFQVKRVKGAWVAKAKARVELVRKAASRVVEARSPGSMSAPIILRLMSPHGTTEITIFTNDQTYSNMLVDAINEVWQKLTDPPPKVACPQEKAAYEAQARAYGWMTDEEKHPGTGPYHGVVHPDGWWAPDWKAACEKDGRA
jgi:hypothetical protein